MNWAHVSSLTEAGAVRTQGRIHSVSCFQGSGDLGCCREQSSEIPRVKTVTGVVQAPSPPFAGAAAHEGRASGAGAGEAAATGNRPRWSSPSSSHLPGPPPSQLALLSLLIRVRSPAGAVGNSVVVDGSISPVPASPLRPTAIFNSLSLSA